jgi:hypothetical protein
VDTLLNALWGLFAAFGSIYVGVWLFNRLGRERELNEERERYQRELEIRAEVDRQLRDHR